MKKFRETENWKEKYKIFPSPKINSIKSFKSISFWPFKMNIMHLSLLFKCTFIEKCASLVAQLVKNPPATWETWVRSLGWGDPLEKGKSTDYSILVVAKSLTGLSDFHRFPSQRQSAVERRFWIFPKPWLPASVLPYLYYFFQEP